MTICQPIGIKHYQVKEIYSNNGPSPFKGEIKASSNQSTVSTEKAIEVDIVSNNTNGYEIIWNSKYYV